MKNKLVINIIVAYFVVLCVVLVVQLNGEEREIVTQGQTVEADAPKTDRLKDSLIMKVGNSSVYMNNRLFSIDEQNELIVPKIINKSAFVPAKLFSSAFKGEVSWDSDLRQIVMRYNNKAVILKENENKINIIDNINEEEKKIKDSLKIIDSSAYVPLKPVAEAFDKSVFFDRGIIVISNYKNDFDFDEEEKFIDEIVEKFKTRNVFVFEINNSYVYSNSKIISIDEQNNKLAPVKGDKQFYIPIKAISSIFNGQSSWNAELKEITLSYNNTEATFKNKSDDITVIKNGEKSKIQMPGAIQFLNEYSYLSIDAFSELFNKNVIIDKNFIIISGKDNVFEKEKDSAIIEKLEKNIKKISN